MNIGDISHLRLTAQGISEPRFKKAEDVVKWLVAVQSQDYYGGKWALGLRSQGVSDTDIENAFNAGEILRTHVMRPTWHFVLPADIRWLLLLTAPRVHKISAYYFSQVGLDDELFKKSQKVLTKALENHTYLTRDELRVIFKDSGIFVEKPLLMGFILFRAELERIITSGPRKGKQFTYALFDERVPEAKTFSQDEALGELSKRYLQSRGIASPQDFSWWSGLSVTDAKKGFEMVKPDAKPQEIDGKEFWVWEDLRPKPLKNHVYLLPNYDEYISSYKDRSALLDDEKYVKKFDSSTNIVFAHLVVIHGKILGTWKRTFAKDSVSIETQPFRPFTKDEKEDLERAEQSYKSFLTQHTP